ncbi:MAG: hypothetical protein Q8R67_05060 [Rhodoferax sp.]|nr:hypothetical protein [Rhodoferax sp.]MDP3651035.1 hypothetical protein [Rhodoferax sp.]
MAYIGKFRDGWRAQIQRDGVRASKTFKTKRLAQAWVVEQEAKETLAKAYTLRDAVTKYLETVSVHKRDAVDWERRRFDALIEHFGEVPLDSITSESIGEWRTGRLNDVSGSTILRESGLYRNLFKVAQKEWRWLTVNPYDGVRLPKANAPRVQVWRWQQIKRVLRGGQRVGGKTLEVTQAFHIALRTGMRLKEAIMAPEYFDRNRRVVDLPHTKTAPKGETVPLTKQGYRVMCSTPPRFEVSESRASMLFCLLCDNLLISDLQFRDARATALTLMARRMDVLTLARISRHKDLRLLISTYYRETPEDISRRL